VSRVLPGSECEVKASHLLGVVFEVAHFKNNSNAARYKPTHTPSYYKQSIFTLNAYILLFYLKSSGIIINECFKAFCDFWGAEIFCLLQPAKEG